MESEHGLSPEQLWVVGMAHFHGVTTMLTPVSKALPESVLITANLNFVFPLNVGVSNSVWY